MYYYLHQNRAVPGVYVPAHAQNSSSNPRYWHCGSFLFISSEVTGTIVVTPNRAKLEVCQPRNHESQQCFWTPIFWQNNWKYKALFFFSYLGNYWGGLAAQGSLAVGFTVLRVQNLCQEWDTYLDTGTLNTQRSARLMTYFKRRYALLEVKTHF